MGNLGDGHCAKFLQYKYSTCLPNDQILGDLAAVAALFVAILLFTSSGLK